MKIAKTEFIFLIPFIVRGFFFGPTVYILFNVAKNNAWLSVILAFLVSFIPLLLYYKLQNINPSKDVVENINSLKFGKIINLLILLFLIFFASIVLWNLTNFVRSLFLFKTPIVVISSIFIVISSIIALKGIRTIARSSVIYFLINILLFIAAIIALVSKIDLNYLLPFENSGFIDIIKASIICIGYNCLPMFLLLIIPKNNIKDNQNYKKSLITIYSISFFSIFIVIFLCTTILGYNMSNLYQYPEFHILKTISIGNFFRRVEGVIAIQWLLDGIILLTMCLYFTKISFIKIFNLENKNIYLILISLITLVISVNAFNNNTIAKEYLLNIQPYINYIFLFILPLLAFIFLSLKKRKRLL